VDVRFAKELFFGIGSESVKLNRSLLALNSAYV